MLKKTILAGAAIFALTLSAQAFQCPADMAKIDEALKVAQLSDADKAKVMELRTKGEADHAAGNHDASVKELAEAKKILNIE